MKNNKTDYQSLNNKPIGCSFCGAHIQGQIIESRDPRTKKIEKQIRWTCKNCGNLVRIGRPN